MVMEIKLSILRCWRKRRLDAAIKNRVVRRRLSLAVLPAPLIVARYAVFAGLFYWSFPASAQRAGDQFQDCDACPVMVIVPAGSFVMGSPEAERGRLDHEGPQHEVLFNQPFAAGKYEITFSKWDACVKSGGCEGYVPADEGWGRGDRPVVNVNYYDMKNYLSWLSGETDKAYRFLTEAEWEYSARAGSKTVYPWGDDPARAQANFGTDTCCSGRAQGADKWDAMTAPVGSFPANAFGLHDMHGNVYERVEDCWNHSYDGAPADGAHWLTGDCTAFVLRGGSWISPPELIRSAERDAYTKYYRAKVMGFRVARSLDD